MSDPIEPVFRLDSRFERELSLLPAVAGDTTYPDRYQEG